MRVYLDTSVAIRVLFREPHPFPGWGQWTEAHTSRIWHTEILRVLDRIRLTTSLSDEEFAIQRSNIELLHSIFHIMPLTEAILARASEAFPTVIGTLDAIHLATALLIRDQVGLDALLTHDTQLATAATAVGLHVQGV